MNITIRDGLAVALKFLGFYFIYMALSSLILIINYIMLYAIPSQVTALESSGITKFALFIPSVIPCILSSATAYILLKYSDRISEKLILVDKEIQIFNTDTWQKEVFIIALKIFGAYQVIQEIATFAWQIALEKDYKDVVYTLICIVIGLYLLSGAKHIVNLVFKEKKPEPLSSNPTDSTTPSAESAKSA